MSLLFWSKSSERFHWEKKGNTSHSLTSFILFHFYLLDCFLKRFFFFCPRLGNGFLFQSRNSCFLSIGLLDDHTHTPVPPLRPPMSSLGSGSEETGGHFLCLVFCLMLGNRSQHSRAHGSQGYPHSGERTQTLPRTHAGSPSLLKGVGWACLTHGEEANCIL